MEPQGRATQQSRDTKKTKQKNSFLFPIKMIAKLEWTQSNVQQNIEHLTDPTMGVTINNTNRTITIERTAA